MNKKLYRNKEWFYQKYWAERLSCPQMAVVADCSLSTIRRWMEKHDILVRDSRAAQLAHTVGKPYRDKEWLEQRYVKEGLALAQIARLADCSVETIRTWLKRCGISVRGYAEAVKIRWARGDFDSEEVRQKHSVALKKAWEREERRNKTSGKNNYRWKGGVSFEPYPPEFNGALKRAIRKRDNRQCAVCGGRGNCVHHIDGDKQNNNPSNLITLDNRCHTKIHHNMESWEAILSFIATARTKPH
jgi:uncharacterized protein YjcR